MTEVTIDGMRYGLEGTIHAGPNTRKNNGLVLEAVLHGIQGGLYTLNCYENGQTAFYARGANAMRFDLITRNPKVC